MHPKYQDTLNLRRKGKSYREIARDLGVSKGSVSNWCKDLKLSVSAQRLLEKKSNYPREKFAEYNRQKSERVKQENETIEKQAIKQIHSLSKRELCLIGTALYWGEGWKRQDSQTTPCISLGNSDPYMILIFLRFLKEVLDIPKEKIRPSIQIHKNIERQVAIEFWSNITKIPRSRFRIRSQISRASKGKRPFNSLLYGTLELRVSGRKEFFRIRGWIAGVAQQGDLRGVA